MPLLLCRDCCMCENTYSYKLWYSTSYVSLSLCCYHSVVLHGDICFLCCILDTSTHSAHQGHSHVVALLLSVPGIDVDAHNRVHMIVIVSLLAHM